MTMTAQADKKGRVTLGKRFAGKTVIIQDREDSSVVVMPAVVIPEREVWLYRNQEALSAVQNGLAQAREQRFVAGPDLPADANLAEQLDD